MLYSTDPYRLREHTQRDAESVLLYSCTGQYLRHVDEVMRSNAFNPFCLGKLGVVRIPTQLQIDPKIIGRAKELGEP